jgi:hypothetical protein
MKCPLLRDQSEPCPRKHKDRLCYDCLVSIEETAAVIAEGEKVDQTEGMRLAIEQARDAMPGQKVLL